MHSVRAGFSPFLPGLVPYPAIPCFAEGTMPLLGTGPFFQERGFSGEMGELPLHQFSPGKFSRNSQAFEIPTHRQLCMVPARASHRTDVIRGEADEQVRPGNSPRNLDQGRKYDTSG